jgi:hypothetical protein
MAAAPQLEMPAINNALPMEKSIAGTPVEFDIQQDRRKPADVSQAQKPQELHSADDNKRQANPSCQSEESQQSRF